MVKFPYSQWTVGLSGSNLYWSFSDSLLINASFIAIPENNWEEWHQDLLNYRGLFHDKLLTEEPLITGLISSSDPGTVHFNKFGYDLNLLPGEQINISGELKSPETRVNIVLGFELKTKKQELSYLVKKRLPNSDSLSFFPSGSSQFFSINSTIPAFSSDSFSISPVIRFLAMGTESEYRINVRNITPEVEVNSSRLKLKHRIEKHLERESNFPEFEAMDNLMWMKDNYVMGFAFLWDNDIWDHRERQFRIQDYCDKMKKEFGGFNSVIFWHTYPNIGIDERNQFDFLYNIPKGLDGFKEVVSLFHENNVKVFITYNPWDLDTRQPENGDAEELAEIINYSNADGVFLDTWGSSTGEISIFSQENFIREEIEKTGKEVAFLSEVLPEFKDLKGYNALSGSWGPETEPFHYTDLSHIKWLLPWHKQYFIKRMKKKRKRELAHAWLNGQGIMVWENIFGTMNPWHAGDRQILRKMNAIWNRFGEVYLIPEWQPFISLSGNRGLASSWNVNGFKIWNIVNKSENRKIDMQIPVDTAQGRYFYDIWNGAQVYPEYRYSEFSVNLQVNDFSCLLQSDSAIHHFHDILFAQQTETVKNIPGIFNDRYIQEQSLKYPLSYPYTNTADSLPIQSMLMIPEGEYHFEVRHIQREGHCYPDNNAVDNHDLNIKNEKEYPEIIHHHTEEMDEYHIMPGVVTNAEFELFLDLTGYTPDSDRNFLKHWDGPDCPDEIRNEPVVYVSLEDARAFADWTGMRLPTEWQWQKAAELHPREFVFNKVFEWNESERFDGFNRFVNLRGGCSSWVLSGSWRYFPGTPYGETAGGTQSYDSHCKYLLMYPGQDRASTIGFRCVW